MKKLFAKTNMSFMMALQLLVLPLIICLVISVIFMGYEMDTTYGDTERLYFDTLYQINSKLVNADRDYYQSMVAAQQYISISQSEGNLPPELMETLYAIRVATYNENIDQMLERVKDSAEQTDQGNIQDP